MKKLDRFERMVLGVQKKNVSEVLYAHDVVTLLRREHTWMKRMVLKVANWQAEQLAESDDILHTIMEQLERRRK